MKRFLRRLLALLVVLAVLDGLLSLTWLHDGRVGKRPLPPFGALTDPAQVEALERIERGEKSPNAVTVFDRELGWCLAPGSSSPDGSIHVHARGWRGERDYADPAATDALRIVCYGDSFTFGDEVRDEWTFAAMLEAADPRVEALNFGVPAYGTDQALLRFRREGRRGARVVVCGLLLENIGRNVNRYRTLWSPRTQAPLVKPRFALERGELHLVPQPFEDAPAMARAVRDGSVLELLGEHEHWLGRPEVVTGRWSSFGRLIAGFLAYRARTPERLWLDETGEPRRVSLALLERFRTEAIASGAERFLVLVFPLRGELDDFVDTGRSYWRELVAELQAGGFDVLDTAPALADEERRLAAERSTETLWVAAHLSSVGNLVVARELQRWLAAELP